MVDNLEAPALEKLAFIPTPKQQQFLDAYAIYFKISKDHLYDLVPVTTKQGLTMYVTICDYLKYLKLNLLGLRVPPQCLEQIESQSKLDVDDKEF